MSIAPAHLIQQIALEIACAYAPQRVYGYLLTALSFVQVRTKGTPIPVRAYSTGQTKLANQVEQSKMRFLIAVVCLLPMIASVQSFGGLKDLSSNVLDGLNSTVSGSMSDVLQSQLGITEDQFAGGVGSC